MSDGEAFCWFAGGALVALLLLGLIWAFKQPNISDEELYRFCIVRKIELADCVIPPMNLPKDKQP